MFRWCWLVILLVFGCGPTESEQTVETQVAAGPHEVEYHVSWDTSDVTFRTLVWNCATTLDTTSSFALATWFYSTQLVPCEDEESSNSPKRLPVFLGEGGSVGF